jgi:hypothetical protein
MSCQNKQDFCIGAGETFQPVLRWGSEVLISKPITAISQAAPAVVTAVGHAVPDGWRVAVVSAKGMTQINAENFPPRGTDWQKATVLTVDTVQLNKVNSADYAAYSSGGFLVYNTPVTLAGMTGVFTIRDAPLTGTVLATLTSSPAAGLTLNDTTKQILPVLATAALTWTTGYYDLELTDTGGKITQLLSGVITIN